MKKLALLCLFVSIIGGSVFAQAATPAPTPATIKGPLGLSNGRIIVVSGGVTYYVRGIQRFVGYIDGLKDGAQVTLEGFVAPPKEGQKERMFNPVKLILNGKTYEVGSADTASKMGPRRDGHGPKGDQRGDSKDKGKDKAKDNSKDKGKGKK
jgi:hypothetical protein